MSNFIIYGCYKLKLERGDNDPWKNRRGTNIRTGNKYVYKYKYPLKAEIELTTVRVKEFYHVTRTIKYLSHIIITISTSSFNL